MGGSVLERVNGSCQICDAIEPCDHMPERLEEALRSANARVTFDRGRNNTHPCTFCGCSPKEREVTTFDLVTIGTYKSGAALTRPVCAPCKVISRGRWA